ncbi:MAG: hypothetical protein NTZ48_03095 [Candidatus Omnitrophica bacterium]|nr:hypothetical protein [Candidatus Omnitrophota bacterium]
MNYKTTAIYPNRIRDKEELEQELDLPEFGESVDIVFITRGGYIIARGYNRIVYGDGGAYIEFIRYQINWSCLILERGGFRGYFHKLYTPDRVMIYDQIKTVEKLPNPPRNPGAFRGNRKEGYADYRIGMLYIDPHNIIIVRN